MIPLQAQPPRAGNLAHPSAALCSREFRGSYPARILSYGSFCICRLCPFSGDHGHRYRVGAALARVIMALAFIAMLLFGGDLHAIFSKIGLVILTFTLWLCVCVPFSVWRGGSVEILRQFWLLALFSFMIIAASVRGLEQCRKIMYTLAAATMFIEAFTS